MTTTLTAPARLRLEDLVVTSYSTTVEAAAIDPYCCTGCDSGCGINPTAGGCESAGEETGEGICW